MRVSTVLILLLSACNVLAQFKVVAELDSSEILIGQQTLLRIEASGVTNPNAIEWPDFRAELPKEIELIETSAVIKKPDADQVYELTLLITSWDSGYFAIEPIPISYLGTESKTEAMLFIVNNVTVDLTAAPRAIKDIYDEPFNLIDWIRSHGFLLVCIYLGLLMIGLVLKFLESRSSTNRVTKEVEIPLPPHELALKRIEALSSSSSYKEEDKKPFYSDLTEILREYLEGRFFIPAPEQTSVETIESVRYLGLEQQWQDHFRSLLRTADMVKFAKERTNESIAEKLLNRSKEFILDTLPVQKSEEDE